MQDEVSKYELNITDKKNVFEFKVGIYSTNQYKGGPSWMPFFKPLHLKFGKRLIQKDYVLFLNQKNLITFFRTNETDTCFYFVQIYLFARNQ